MKKERNEALLAMWRNGCSAKYIAHELGISLGRVYAIARQHGARKRPNPLAAVKRNAQMAAMYREGHSLRDVALHFGVSRQRVWAVLREAGETLRPNGKGESLSRAIDMYRQGLPLAEICEATGYAHVSSLSNALRAAGVPPRTKQ